MMTSLASDLMIESWVLYLKDNSLIWDHDKVEKRMDRFDAVVHEYLRSHRKTVEELCEKIDCSPSSLWRFRTKPECFRKAPLDVIASCLRLANASNEQVRYILGL